MRLSYLAPNTDQESRKAVAWSTVARAFSALGRTHVSPPAQGLLKSGPPVKATQPCPISLRRNASCLQGSSASRHLCTILSHGVQLHGGREGGADILRVQESWLCSQNVCSVKCLGSVADRLAWHGMAWHSCVPMAPPLRGGTSRKEGFRGSCM